jgi:tetratricopeptide (TPR) repeat protein
MNESVDWRSYVENTRSNYITQYVTCAQQNTDNYQKLDLELINMMGVAEQALDRAKYDAVLEMARWLWSDGGRFLDLQGHTQDGVQLLTQAVEAARLSGNRDQEGRLLGQLGRASLTLKELPEAANYFEQAVKIAREVGDRQGEASHLGCLGQIYLDQENKQKAADYFQEALSIVRKIGNRQMEGRLLASLGLAKLGHTGRSIDEAIEHFEKAVAIARDFGDRQGEASHLGCLGIAWELLCSARPEPPRPPPFVWGPYLADNDSRYQQYNETVVRRYEQACQARYHESIEYYERALAIAREIGDRQMEKGFSANVDRVSRPFSNREVYDGNEGDYYAEIERYERSFGVTRRIGDQRMQRRPRTDLPIGRSMAVALVTYHGRYVTAMNDEGSPGWVLRAETNVLKDWEKFTLFCLDDGKVVLETFHGRYVTAVKRNRDWVLRAETNVLKDWEKFTLVEPETEQEMSSSDMFKLLKQKSSIRIALKTRHNRYVTAMTDEGHQDWVLRAATKTLNDWEEFTVVLLQESGFGRLYW